MAAAFAGTWVLDSSKSDSIDDLLSAQGVGFLKRKVIANLSVTLVITAEGNKIKIRNETSVKVKESEFELGGDWIEVEEELTELKGQRKGFLDGDKFVVVSKNDNGETTVTRTTDGKTLKAEAVLVKPDGSKVQATRIFNKQ